MSDSVQRLRQRWLAQGLQVGSGANEAEIADFEARHGIRFANDVREYLGKLNGLSDVDSDYGRLFPLPEFEPVRDLLVRAGGDWAQSPLLSQGVASFFIFGDYDFAIAHWAVKPGPNSEVVVIDNPADARKVADTLDQFLSIYAADGPDALL